ncbi:alpha/beta fold hydrolase [Saccharopolyspora griseoalba]|uniref:Alpha/beta fold hydrolase n=1 Tax=Saccharopolyspora griseoalba TaxID=1431848 RepID=A0ABW2LF07_9PSEU
MEIGTADYAHFLPAEHRERCTEPRSDWWDWRGRRVHLLRSAPSDAPVRLLGVHGAGGRAAALWPAISAVAGELAEIVVPDLPLFGDTVEPDPTGVRYSTWIEMLADLVLAESGDRRPLVLFGASMGGLLAYQTAARTRLAAAVVATCLLDPSDPEAMRSAARIGALGAHARALLAPLARVAGRARLPLSWVDDLGSMSRDPRLSRLCARDRKGGATRVPIAFLSDFAHFEHTRPEQFDAAPLTLAHPAEDGWTPPANSIRFLERVAAPARLVLLEGCGHFPIEEPGLGQLRSTARRVLREAT